MKFFSFIAFSMLLGACQPEFESVNPYAFVKQDLTFFSGFINDGAVSSSKSQKVILSNDHYPIDISLFADGKFYYDLPNLGDGTGTWTHKEGHLDLYAERKLFAMQMTIHNVKESPNDLVVHFTDRFGTQYLPLVVNDIP